MADNYKEIIAEIRSELKSIADLNEIKNRLSTLDELSEIKARLVVLDDIVEIKEHLKALDCKFESLYKDGPIPTLDTRVTVLEGKVKAIIAAGLLFGAPVISYVALEVFKRIFGS